MKKALLALSVASCFSLALAADTYWQVWCNTESRVVTNALTKEEAQKWASKHVLETGHTVTTSEHERGK